MKRIYALLLLLLPVLLLLGLLASSVVGRADAPEVAGAPVESPTDAAHVAWNLVPADFGQVESATVTFDTTLAANHLVCVQVTADSPPTPNILTNGCFTLVGALAMGSPQTVFFASLASAEDITGVSVTVVEQVAATLGAASEFVHVIDTDWTLDTIDTTLVTQVDVHIAPFDEVEDPFDITLVLKDLGGTVLQQKTFATVTMSTVGNTTLNWALSPFVSAEAITRFEIQVDEADEDEDEED